ncbi:MAG: hypothetical protein K8L99_16575 [Anaerolineae bacterium]|nr:hypothetical protein [Anaerolineae bacterium]
MDILRETLSEQLNFLKDNPLLSVFTLAGIGVAVCLLFWLIWRQSGEKQPLRERVVIGLLGLAFGLLLLNYFFPGDFVRGDGSLHMARTWLLMDVLQKGELPIWSNRFYFGHPQELFFGFNTYLSIIGVSKLTGLDLFASTKLLLWLVHVASGLFMYLYARKRSLNTGIAILVATAYVISWQHFGVVRRFGILPLALIYFWIPLFFLLLEYWLQKRVKLVIAAILGGVLCAMSIITHIQYGTYLSVTYMVVLAWIISVSTVYRDWQNVRRTILLGVGTGIIAFLLAGWLAVPSMLERVYLPSIPQVLGTLSLDGIITAMLNIGLITNLLDSWGQGYVGLSILVPALIGGLVAVYHLIVRRKISKEKLISGYPFFIAAIGFILLDPIKRYTSIWLFFVCIVAGYGIAWIVQHLVASPSRIPRLYQAAILFILLELGPALLLVGGYRDMASVHDDVARLQNELETKGTVGRIMVFQPDRGVFWRAEDTMMTNASIPFGGSIEEATHPFNIMAAISNQLATEVYDGSQQPSPELLNLLRLMNVRYVVMDDNDIFGVSGATPVLFAPAVQVAEVEDPNGIMGQSAREMYEKRQISTDYVNAVAQQMQLDVGQPQAGAILVKEPINSMPEHSGACLTEQPFTFEGAVERHNTVALNYNACGDGYIRLAYAYYPLLRLEIDGILTSFYPDAFNMIVFAAPKGKHQVTLTAVVSPLREGFFRVAGVSAIAILVWAVVQVFSWYSTRKIAKPQTQLQQGYSR